MAIPNWPAGLTYAPTRNSVAFAAPWPKAATTEPEDGPARQRRRSFTSISKFNYAIPFRTPAEVAAFESFARDDLDEGTGHFMMNVVIPGQGCVSRRVYIEGGQFGSQPLGGGGQLVSFTLCVFPAGVTG